MVAYSNEVKRGLLGVPAETLEGHGAVSAETAAAMAEGARTALGADVAVSVTGVAGPGGGTAEKPVGLVYLHAAGPDGALAAEFSVPADRATIRARATVTRSAPVAASLVTEPAQTLSADRAVAWAAMNASGSSAPFGSRTTPSTGWSSGSASALGGVAGSAPSRARTSTSRSRSSAPGPAASVDAVADGSGPRPRGVEPPLLRVRALPRDAERRHARLRRRGRPRDARSRDDCTAGWSSSASTSRERRAWLPHVTVAPLPRAAAAAAERCPDLGPVVPSDAAVYLSRLRPGGAQYEVLESVALGG